MSDHMDLEWRWPTKSDYHHLSKPWVWGRHGARDLRVLAPATLIVLPVTHVTVIGATGMRIVAGPLEGIDWSWEIAWVGGQPYRLVGNFWAEPD